MVRPIQIYPAPSQKRTHRQFSVFRRLTGQTGSDPTNLQFLMRLPFFYSQIDFICVDCQIFASKRNFTGGIHCKKLCSWVLKDATKPCVFVGIGVNCALRIWADVRATLVQGNATQTILRASGGIL